jgi:hypothetical protein
VRFTIDPNTLQPAPAGIAPVLPKHGGRIAVDGAAPESLIIYPPFGQEPLLAITGWSLATAGVYAGAYTALIENPLVLRPYPTVEATFNGGWRFHMRVGDAPPPAPPPNPLGDQIDAALTSVLAAAIAQATTGAATRFKNGRLQIYDTAAEVWLDASAKHSALRLTPDG